MERRDRGLPRDHPKITCLDRVINWVLTCFLTFRDINKDRPEGKSLYLRRYFIKRGKDTIDGSGEFIHFFARSDDDRHPHDHPWPFSVYILNRGYFEEDVNGVEHFRKPRVWRHHTANWFHRVHLTEGPVWTLFRHKKREKVWGFLTEDGWVPHDEYSGLNQAVDYE